MPATGPPDDFEDRDHLRRVFSELGDKAGEAFDKVDGSRLSMALIRSCAKAGELAHNRGDHKAALDWYLIHKSLISTNLG